MSPCGRDIAERNSRKFRRAHEGAAVDGDIPASFIERVMSPFKAPDTPGPRVSKHTYVDDGSYDNNESPISETAAAVGERPVLDGAQGNDSGLNILERIGEIFTSA